jgi:hypothetical protein
MQCFLSEGDTLAAIRDCCRIAHGAKAALALITLSGFRLVEKQLAKLLHHPWLRVSLYALQIAAHLRRVLIAQVAVLLQRLADDAIQLSRYPRIHHVGRWRGPAQNGLVNDRRRRARERLPPRGHFVQRHPMCIDSYPAMAGLRARGF